MDAGDYSEIFSDLSEYNTIVAYVDSPGKLDSFDTGAGGKKIYLDLGVSDKLKEKFLQHYGVEKLPCMVKFGCKVYLDGDGCVGLEEAVEKENEHYRSVVNSLVNTAKIFVFIKGRVSDPKCKFTRQLLGVFDEQKLVYERDYFDFDILSDESMREKLKVLNSWPTYPQVFVNGKFVGGLDTVRDAASNGTFCALLG